MDEIKQAQNKAFWNWGAAVMARDSAQFKLDQLSAELDLANLVYFCLTGKFPD